MSDATNLEPSILDFERAWRAGARPKIEDFLPRSDRDADRFCLLIELICVDLEFRWRSHPDDALPNPTLSEYIERFPLLKSLDELPLDLIEEEYWNRRRYGGRPSHDSFLSRFPTRRSEILPSLLRIDGELQAEIDCDSMSPAESLHERGMTTSKDRTDARAVLSFEDYVLQEMIGAGRMGKVYRARERCTDRAVAVKYLRKSFQSNFDLVERFIGEANTVAQFEHPGIVKVHGLGQTPAGGYFIVMELIEGCNLADRLASSPLSVRDAVEWMIAACNAMEHAHVNGIIHCDLKPANLLLDLHNNIHVTDFGFARSIRDEADPVYRIEGTAAFMAPEQISAWWGPMSPRTDIYGIGAVLYTLLTGQPPYSGTAIADILTSVVSGVRVIPPIELRRDVPIAVNDVCLRCLAKPANQRYANMHELHAALRDSLLIH